MTKDEIAMFAKKTQAEEVHYWTISQAQLERYTHYVLSEHKRKHGVETKPREWVGLTDGEIDAAAFERWGEMKGFPLEQCRAFACAIEAALKEKNT